MHPALRSTAHRPWPLPSRPWLLRMRWRDLAFIHYPIEAASIAATLPPGLQVDTFDGRAWIGLVPFVMADVAPRGLPAVPGLSTFPEVNIRTYVTAGGKPGAWFYSLDADSGLTVFAGRRLFGLPYFSARMHQSWRDGQCHLSSRRTRGTAVFHGRYRPTGDVFLAQPGSFEHWAAERYCLYAHTRRRGLLRLEVHHPPWPLQTASLELDACSLETAAGFPPLRNPVCHFSRGVDVISYSAHVVPHR